ncbi:MAG: hypothetical protein JW908_03020 [Anaerolineales bacterium]|nr:hypothetical protein [Anaerolineales bacterium]
MFEIPEIITLTQQINQNLTGKIIRQGSLGNSPHKFVWYNRSHEEFASLTKRKTVGVAWSKGRWLFIPLEPGYVLVFGEFGGKLIFHPAGSEMDKKYHLWLDFEEGSFLTAFTQMWGAMELYEAGKEQERQYIKGMRPTPMVSEFSLVYFNDLIDELLKGEKRSVKSLLTQDQLIPGLGNAIAQDIMFNAGLHPRRSLADLNSVQRQALYVAIRNTLEEAIHKGGRYDEFDLFGQRGKYVRLMDSKAAGQPCPVCGATIEKMQYLGGACYFCPSCQE